MKQHLFVLVAALTAGSITLCCQDNSPENTPETKTATSHEIRSYWNVVGELKASGCTEINLNDTDIDFSETLTPGYKEYAVFYNEKEKQYIIPARYDPADVDIIDLAKGECNHFFSNEPGSKTGERTLTCAGDGNDCHYEVSVNKDGIVYVLIVVCK